MGIERGLKRCAAALLIAAAAGCTVGPEFHRPNVDAPPAWSAAASSAADGTPSRPVAAPFDGRHWWSVFGDPVLDALIDDAAQQNIDLRTAAVRIASARVQADAAAGKALPSIAGSGLAGRTRMSEHGVTSALGGSSGSSSGGPAGASEAPALTTNLFQAGFDATWELDLWGGVRRNVEAARAGVASAEEARHEALASLCAEIARTYFGLRGSQRQRAIVQADIATQQRMAELLASRQRAGLASLAEVAGQRAQVEALKAQLPALDQATVQSRSRLALLLALPPGALDARLDDAASHADRLPPEVPVGLPGELLQRRPDVRRSEDELRAATAKIGVATAKLFPSITLGLSAGLQATDASDLGSWASRFFLGGAAISLPIFQGGQLRAQVQLADLDAQRAALAYRQAVLTAVHDADTALVAYADEQRRAGALGEQLAQARKRRALVEDQWHQGLVAHLEVLDAERSAHQSELQLAQSATAVSTDLVALYKALGGGWQPN
jgi:NodT family efflux transporter outer membrane factor (OMF) lipoprotein